MKSVGLIFGGESREHNVSIISALTIFKALRRDSNSSRFKVILFYIDKKGKWWGGSIAEEVLIKGFSKKIKGLSTETSFEGFTELPQESNEVEIWFPVLHGPNGEDGTIQGLLKLTKKPFVGSGILGSALGMDKIAMKAAFSAAKIPQVEYLGLNKSIFTQSNKENNLIEQLEKKLHYPLFVKPANLGSSVGVSKAFNRKELLQSLKKAGDLDERIIVEESVEARELECAILGGNELRTSVVGEISFNADWYDYHTKYSEGNSESLIPAPIPKKIEKQVKNYSLKACEAVNASGLARVDFFYNENTNQIWINEINTMPGFTPKSMYPLLWEASGINLEQLVAKLLYAAGE